MQISHSLLGLPLACLLAPAGSPVTPPAPVSVHAPAAPVAPATSSERLLRAVPEEAMVVGAAWDVDALRKRGTKSTWYRFYQDEQVQTFVDALGGMVTEAWESEGGGPEVPFTVGEVWDALHGSLVVYVDVDVRNESVSAGLLIAPGGERAGLEEIFDALLGMAGEDLESSVESYGGAELSRFSGEAFGEGEMIFLDHPDLMGIVASNDIAVGLEAAQGALDRFSGTDESPGFGASAALREARATSGVTADFEMFFDAGPVIQGVIAEEQPSEEELALLDRIGVTKLRWLHVASFIGEGEKAETTMSLYLPPASYIADAFQLIGPAPIDMLKRMPSGADSVSVARFDVYGLYKLIFGAIQEHDPETHQQASGMVQMIGAMNGIDIEKDVLAQITGDFGNFMIPSTDDVNMGQAMMTGLAPGAAMLIGIEDTEEFELFVDDLLTNFQLDQMMETEEFMGREIRSFDMGGPKAYFAFTDGALVYAGGLEPMHAVLRMGSSDDQPTAFDDPQMKKLARPGVLSLSQADTAATLAMQLEMVSGMSEMFGMMGMQGDNPIAYLPWPDAELAGKYFDGHMFSTMVRKGDVFVLRSWSE